MPRARDALLLSAAGLDEALEFGPTAGSSRFTSATAPEPSEWRDLEAFFSDVQEDPDGVDDEFDVVVCTDSEDDDQNEGAHTEKIV